MGRPRKPKKPPKWQAGVDKMSPWFATGLAPLVQPWGLIAAGAATVVNAKLSSVASYLALIAFCLIASGSYIAMEAYAGSAPGAAQGRPRRVGSQPANPGGARSAGQTGPRSGRWSRSAQTHGRTTVRLLLGTAAIGAGSANAERGVSTRRHRLNGRCDQGRSPGSNLRRARHPMAPGP
jgi:hypothetical protein